MKVFFLLGAVAVATSLDCSNENYFMRTPNNGGTKVIYDSRLYQAAWSVNQIPTVDMGWRDLGPCESMPPTPDCWPAYVATAAYPNPNSQVSVNGDNYVNQWYADPGSGPATGKDESNWLRVHSCGTATGPVVTSTTTAAPTTTTLAPTTTTPVPPAPEPTTTTTVPPAPVPTTTTRVPPAPESTTTTIAGPTSTLPSTTTTTQAATTTTPGPNSTTSRPSEQQQRPNGPIGPMGECVWPAWESTKDYPGSFRYFVTHKGSVYSLNYYCDKGREPGVDPCWNPRVATCDGEPPVVKLTAAELAAMVDPNGPKYQSFIDHWDPASPSTSELAIDFIGQQTLFNADEKRALNSLKVLDLNSIEAITPGRDLNPENVKRVERIFTQATFDQLFPVRHSAYTYENLLKGVGALPAYCQTYADGRESDRICLKLLITSFAHNTQEVGANTPSLRYKDGTHMMDGQHYHPESDAYFKEGDPIPLWKQALWFIRETGYSEEGPATSGYRRCVPDSQDSMMWALNYQCPADRDYFGRGSKQLSYNYNFGMFSKLLFGDADYLLANPRLVAETWLNFASGIWFSVTPQSPKPSMLDVLDGSWVPNAVDLAANIQSGFGATINILNGGVECDITPVSQQVLNRIEAYKNFAQFFGYTIPASEQLDCSQQKKFQEGGAGDLKIYWANSWACSYLCQPVSYQTAFLGGLPGDYTECVNYYWRQRWVDRDTKKVVGQYGTIGEAAVPPV